MSGFVRLLRHVVRRRVRCRTTPRLIVARLTVAQTKLTTEPLMLRDAVGLRSIGWGQG